MEHTYESIIQEADRSPQFKKGLLAAAEVCRAQGRGDLYKIILDDMVKALDVYLDRFDATGSFDDNTQA